MHVAALALSLTVTLAGGPGLESTATVGNEINPSIVTLPCQANHDSEVFQRWLCVSFSGYVKVMVSRDAERDGTLVFFDDAVPSHTLRCANFRSTPIVCAEVPGS